MAKIIHTADLHIGASFSFLPREKVDEAKEKQWQALKDLVQTANDQHIDAVLIAGDLFDDPSVSGPVVRDAFAILGKCLCPVFISPGNHDYYHQDSPYASSWIAPNIHVFSSRVLSGVMLADHRTMIYGAAFEEDSAKISISTELSGEVNICCLHGDFSAGDSAYNPIKTEKIADSGFDYLAFGHTHQFSGLKKAGRSYYACPGSFCALTAREFGKRGYLLGEVETGEVHFSFLQTDTVRLSRMEVDVSDVFSDEDLQRKIAAEMPDDRENTCLCFTLTGTKYYEVASKNLKEALDRAFFCCLFRDETQKPENLWEGMHEDDLRGAVLRRMYEDLALAQGEDREKILRAAEYLQSSMQA